MESKGNAGGKERSSRLICPASPRRIPSKKKSPVSSPSPSPKPLPNYLKPTISSSHGEVKKLDPTPKPSLNRRRSFDTKPPKPSPTSTLRSLSLSSRPSKRGTKTLHKTTIAKKEAVSDGDDGFSSIGTEHGEPEENEFIPDLDSKETILGISMENQESVELPVADWEIENPCESVSNVDDVGEEDEVVIHEVGDEEEGDNQKSEIEEEDGDDMDHNGSEEKKEKDGVGYNDVIEETASKLLEERKTKVKALVGAFETVISLQDQEQA